MGQPPDRLSRPPRPGDRWFLVGAVAGLAVFDVARTAWVPDGAHFAANVGLAVGVIALGAWAGLSRAEWGLAPSALGRGLRWGAGAYAVVLGVTAIAVAADAVAGWGRFAEQGAGIEARTLAWRVFVRIPVGTVAMEEVAFRGLLLALAARVSSCRAAALTTALLFGLWHLPGEWGGPSLGPVALVAATTAAGVAFVWLRLRSGSLLAPMLAHLATNTVPLTAAWLLAR